MAQIWKGSEVASSLSKRSAQEVEKLIQEGILPALAIVRVGEAEEDLAYERGAKSRCEKAGIAVRGIALSKETSQETLIETIETLNADSSIHGVLLLRPLPNVMDATKVCDTLLPDKDIDGITSASLAGVFTGSGVGFPPCTAQACVEVLDYHGVDIVGKRAVVVGRSLVVGKPLSMMLLGRHATVTLCHTRTIDLENTCRQAEILIVAAGKAKVIGPSHLSERQIVLDVGINLNSEGQLCGDVDFEKANHMDLTITPVPGGIGSVTTAVLAWHVTQAAKNQKGKSVCSVI